VISWVDTGVAGFTKKSGVFFAYGVDGPEFFPALYLKLPAIRATPGMNLHLHLANLTLGNHLVP